MKKTTVVTSIVLGAVVLLMANMSFGVTTTGIIKSKHDLSFGNTSSTIHDGTAANTQICIYCHTPHNASDTNLLWNRTNTGITAANAFKMYSSTTVSATVKAVKTLSVGDTSYKCMTCHDGSMANMNSNTVSSANFTPNLPTTGAAATEWDNTFKIGASPKLTPAGTAGDLRDDHPVAFNYATVQTGNPTGYKLPSAVETAIGTGAAAGKAAFDGAGKMQCGTCHYVHNEGNQRFLLRSTPDSSGLCLKCHNK